MVFGILHRYVIDQVLRSFFLALVAITAIFVLFMVMAEASRQGLTPMDCLRVVPFVVPSSLPYTVPVALLFSVSVVYGRLAGDNEIVAMKTAGLSAWFVLMPTILISVILSITLHFLSSDMIPRSTNKFRTMIFQDVEDMFYKVLKKEGQFNIVKWPFFIGVKDVQERTLIDATFKHRRKENPNTFDLEIFAKKAWIHFLPGEGKIRVELENSETTGTGDRSFLFWVNGRRVLEYPLPSDESTKMKKRLQEMTNVEMAEQQVLLDRKIQQERERQAVAAAMWIGSGRIERVNWADVGNAFKDFRTWKREFDELETEKYLRLSLATGSLFFVMLGAPVGILFARRDFLSSFITCFLPIIVIYYPSTLLGMNLGKEDLVGKWIVFSGNFVLACMAGPVWRRVRKH